FALAAFGRQTGLATVIAGFVAGAFGFLAFNVRPASLYVGRAGRLTAGFVVAVGALAVHPVPGAARQLVTPLLLVAFLLLDAALVVVERLRRRRPVFRHRSDHVVNHLSALGWSASEVVALFVLSQLGFALLAVFTGRAVLPVWLG